MRPGWKMRSQQKQEIGELDEEEGKRPMGSNLLLSPSCTGLEEFCLHIKQIGHQDDQSSRRHSGVGDIWVMLTIVLGVCDCIFLINWVLSKCLMFQCSPGSVSVKL